MMLTFVHWSMFFVLQDDGKKSAADAVLDKKAAKALKVNSAHCKLPT
jgi:hypothetical protein